MCMADILDTIVHKFKDFKVARGFGISHSLLLITWKSGDDKRDHGNHWNVKLGFLTRKSRLRLENAITIWFLLRGITMWTIWMERNGLIFYKNMWDVKKTEELIWRDLLEYVKIAWKGAEKGAIYMDSLGNYDSMWGGQDLLHCRATLEPCIGALERWTWT